MRIIGNFFKKLFQSLFLNEQKIPDTIKILLLDSEMILFYLDIETLSILNCDTDHDFKNALTDDMYFKNCLHTIKDSLRSEKEIIQISININRKYYNVSFFFSMIHQ